MTGSKVRKRAWPIVRLVMIVCLTFASILPYMAGTVSVGASSTPFAFRDDFSYSSVSDMIAAGWTECGGGSSASYSVGNGILSLKDDADAVCWDNAPQGVSDWTVTWRATWSEFSGSWVGTIRMTVGTSQHSYTYAADGYWGYFALIRDGALVFHNGWYSADLNVFHTMRLDMVSGKITMYFDGAVMGSYTEPDPGTSLVELSPTAAGYSHVNFDYVTASSLPARTTPDFSLSGNPSHLILAHGSSVTGNLTLNSINGFSGTVSLQTRTDSAGLTASVSRSTIFLSSTSIATLSVSASPTAVGGRYNVTVSGTSGQASHSFTVSVFTEPNPYVFRDDFNYVSMKEMLAGGWTTSGGFPTSYTVGNGLLTLSQNSNLENTAAVWSAISTGVSDWTVTLRGERIGGSSTGYGDEMRLIAVTATHRYMWTGFELFRDSSLVFGTCCYPQMNTWYDLRLDMIAGTVSAYLNGNLAATYVEADPNTYLNSVGPGSSPMSTDSFDYITASEPSTPYFGFGASPSPLIVISQRSSNTTILVDSRSGFTGNVSLTSTGSSQGPSVSLNPTSVSFTNGGSATSVLTAVAPFATSPEEDFEITVTGTSGNVSRSMSVQVQVFQRYPHAPILFDGNGNFTSANGVRSGTGTATDPYVISDWDIDSSTSTFNPHAGILIRHTTSYFVIRNLYVHSGLKGYDSFYQACAPPCADGIDIQQATNGIVEQNILYWNQNGVGLTGSSNITLIGNNFLQNGFPQYSDDNPKANHWDGGYPVGGNYWSSNTGAVDNCSGPSQNICPDPDGISDSNYGYDRYPLMKPFVASSLVSVVEGLDSNLYSSTSKPDGSWNGWESLSGSSPSTSALCRSGPDRVDLVVRGNDDAIYHKAYSSGVWSASWDRNPSGVTIDQPTCAVLGTTLYVVVRGATSELWATTLDLNTNTWASAWTDLLGFSQSVPGLAATPALNRLDLVVRGFDSRIYHKSFINGAWSQNWDSPSGGTIGAPIAVSDGSSLHIVVIGGASSLWYNSLSLSSNTWTGLVYLSGATSSTPSLVWTPGLDRLDLVVRGMDNGLYHKSLVNGIWSSTWDSLNGLTSNTPAVASDGSTLRVEVVGMDDSLVCDSLPLTAGSWSGWADMTGASTLTPSLG